MVKIVCPGLGQGFLTSEAFRIETWIVVKNDRLPINITRQYRQQPPSWTRRLC